MRRLALNTSLIRSRIPNFAEAARSRGMRPSTISDLVRGKTRVEKAEVGTLVQIAELAKCGIDELILHVDEQPREESFAESLRRWSMAADGTRGLGPAEVQNPVPERVRRVRVKRLPKARVDPSLPPLKSPLEV